MLSGWSLWGVTHPQEQAGVLALSCALQTLYEYSFHNERGGWGYRRIGCFLVGVGWWQREPICVFPCQPLRDGLPLVHWQLSLVVTSPVAKGLGLVHLQGMKQDSTKGSKTKGKATDRKRAQKPAEISFPVVGIGASAGGLEALEQFFAHAPPASGMAFVVIQHLDPTREGMMPELLQRGTAMPVSEVEDCTLVQKNHIYVIPPNKDLSILHGVLHLLEPTAPRGLRLPIDFFLRSLALDQRERSIGVILSGMGSDGTLGLRAIKEKGGLVLVQDPKTAKCKSMPDSAIEAGLADIVAPVGEIPGKIITWLQRKPLSPESDEGLRESERGALEKAVILLREHAGNDFSHYKRNTLHRRIERRMGIHQIERIEAYIRYLRENPQELDLLFKELLIGVTSFFRDRTSWEQLRDVALPALMGRRPLRHPLRAWVPGCSTGEEAYSLAMVMKETVEEHRPAGHCPIQVFATDLDSDAIDRARAGLYPENIAADVPAERLTRFFVKEEGGYRVRAEIREMVVFATQNLIMDPPFTKLDILSCRNLLIYLGPEMQRRLIPLFHYSLNPGGMLFLGSAETVGEFTPLFSPVDSKARLYQRLELKDRQAPPGFPAVFGESEPKRRGTPRAALPAVSLQSLADELVLRSFAPPTVLVNEKGDILYISGRTGKYLEPAAGKANWNLFAMAREGMRNELFGAFQKALRKEERVLVRGLRPEGLAEGHAVDVRMERLDGAGELQGLVIIVFDEVILPATVVKKGRPTIEPRLEELRRELEESREDARLNRESMQTTQEELRSANEEMQSTNEELQSTNEELMTSKEEMQSLNEELQTVNAELQSKVDELSRTSSDMKNLLDSTDIATVFLDSDLNVRRFTERATAVIKLIPGDLGRPITDLSSRLHYPELENDVREVLRKLQISEKTVGAEDDAWFTVRIMPYRTLDNCIDGVVITFADVTTAKRLEAGMRVRHTELEARISDDRKNKKGETDVT
jgi:chemotaxis methyl-accepting protein methylase